MKKQKKKTAAWFRKNLAWLLLFLLALIIAIIWFARLDRNNDKTEGVSLAETAQSAVTTIELFASIELVADEIYDLYIYEGHAGSMNTTMQPYENLYALVGDLLKSIKDYRHFIGTYSKEEDAVMREGIIVLAEKFQKELETHTSLEGYAATTQQRNLFARHVTALQKRKR